MDRRRITPQSNLLRSLVKYTKNLPGLSSVLIALRTTLAASVHCDMIDAEVKRFVFSNSSVSSGTSRTSYSKT